MHTLAQSEYADGGSAAGGAIGAIVGLAFAVVIIASMWRVYTKAGQPGWAAIVPIYNIYVLLKIAGKPGWWLILYLIPIANLIAGIAATIALARNFGKGVGFALGLIFLGFIFFPILAFSDARYQPVG
jgi:hypothetical protein